MTGISRTSQPEKSSKVDLIWTRNYRNGPSPMLMSRWLDSGGRIKPDGYVITIDRFVLTHAHTGRFNTGRISASAGNVNTGTVVISWCVHKYAAGVNLVRHRIAVQRPKCIETDESGTNKRTARRWRLLWRALSVHFSSRMPSP